MRRKSFLYFLLYCEYWFSDFLWKVLRLCIGNPPKIKSDASHSKLTLFGIGSSEFRVLGSTTTSSCGFVSTTFLVFFTFFTLPAFFVVWTLFSGAFFVKLAFFVCWLALLFSFWPTATCFCLVFAILVWMLCCTICMRLQDHACSYRDSNRMYTESTLCQINGRTHGIWQ